MDIIRKNERKKRFYGNALVFEPDLSIQAKMVYTYLCRCADREGRAFPSLNEMGKKCSIGAKRTVLRAIAELEDAGLLRVTRRTGQDGGKLSNLYTLHGIGASNYGRVSHGPN